MADVVSSFPLLGLPNKALMGVLRNMHIVQQMSLSILSKRTKNLVTALELEVTLSFISIQRPVSASIVFGHREKIDFEFMLMDDYELLTKPQFLKVECSRRMEHGPIEWRKPSFEIKDWIDHLLTIFHISKIHQLRFEGEGYNRYNIHSVCDTFHSIKELFIRQSCSNRYSRQILRIFLPVEQLALCTNPFEDPESIHNIFIQNFDTLSCVSPFFQNWPEFGLDDLLTMNSLVIRFYDSELSDRELNSFLKHWINGSNPRMEFIHMSFERDQVLNQNIIFNGMDYQIVPPEQERIFNTSVSNARNLVITGGIDIRRNDGSTATIVIESDPKVSLKMYVWH